MLDMLKILNGIKEDLNMLFHLNVKDLGSSFKDVLIFKGPCPKIEHGLYGHILGGCSCPTWRTETCDVTVDQGNNPSTRLVKRLLYIE
jgi:hypothetical protein